MSSGVGRRSGPQDTLRALAHPVRLQMLSLLTGEALSAADLARRLSITHANASYHLRLLHRAGQVELARVDKIRGGRARIYRAPSTGGPPATPTGEAPDRAPDDHLLVYAALADELRRRSKLAVRTPEQILTDAELWVSPIDWRTFVEALRQASVALHLAARPAGSAATVRVSATIAAFGMATETDRPSADLGRSAASDSTRHRRSPARGRKP